MPRVCGGAGGEWGQHQGRCPCHPALAAEGSGARDGEAAPHSRAEAIQGGARSRVRFARRSVCPNGGAHSDKPVRRPWTGLAQVRTAGRPKSAAKLRPAAMKTSQRATKVAALVGMVQPSSSKGSRIGTKGVGLPLSYTTCQYGAGRRRGSCFAQKERGRQSHRPFSL